MQRQETRSSASAKLFLVEIIDYGPIRRMLLPDNWKKLPDPDDFTHKYARENEKDVEIYFFFRGKPVSNTTASRFCALLAKPPHKLDSEELLDLEVVIRDASEDVYFTLTETHTQLLNGLMVYVVQGHWKLSEVDSLGIFVDCDGDGKIIEEIYYLAPPDRFQMYLLEVRQALNSIEWSRTQ